MERSIRKRKNGLERGVRGGSERTALGLSSGLDLAFKRDGTPASGVAQGWACRFLGRGMVAERGDGAVDGGLESTVLSPGKPGR